MDEDEAQRQIEEVVQPVLRDHGLTLVDLEWKRRRPRSVLRVYVDKPGGVGIDDCQRASRELGDVLDASSLIEDGYDLEVSSPGLDRQLRKDRELQWALGKLVSCWLQGGEQLRGRLTAVAEDRLELEGDRGRVAVDRARVTKVRLEPDVKWPRRAAGT
jgi:ribosome maturation factor RimP